MDPVYDTLALARWLHFTSLFALFGGAIFPFCLGDATATLNELPWTAAWTLRLLRASALLVFGSGLAWLVASLATMSGGFAGALDPAFLRVFFGETPFGLIEEVRLGLLAVLLATALYPMSARAGQFGAIAIASAALLVEQAWLGHAAEGGDSAYGWAMILSYAVHVLAGAVWIGGLPVLLLVILETGGRRDVAGSRAKALGILLRFSAVAIVDVSAVVISGTVNTAFRAGRDVGALIASPYGKIILAKLGLVAAALAIAAHTRFVRMPGMAGSSRSEGDATGHLPIALGAEIALGVLVLSAAAVLGITAPPR